MGLLDEKVAIVTGAGQGIGRAIARAFAREGARVVVNDLGCNGKGEGNDASVAEEVAAEVTAEGGVAVASAHSVRERQSVEALVELAEERFSGVDILVNNAGIVDDANLFDMTDEQWDSVLRTHLTGSFLCTQAVARKLRRRKKPGSIINMTSVSGMLGNWGQLNESAAKAGVYGLTRTASIELQKYRITVNAIAPIAKTRLTEDLPMFEKVGDTMNPEHIAPAALFLASDLCEELSGTVLSVAGGRISTYELAESQGRLKEADNGLWTPQEIAEHYDSIARR